MNFKIGLITILFIASAVVVEQDDQCECGDISAPNDCMDLDCMWDESNSECRDYECADFKARGGCDSSNHCSWTTAGKCAEFTKCEDYVVDSADQCRMKGNTETTCKAPTAAVSGKWTCIKVQAAAATVAVKACATLTLQASCFGTHADGSVCAWKGGAKPGCAELKVEKCEDADSFTEEWCPLQSCKWDATQSKCTEKKCTDLTTEKQCKKIPSADGESTTICKWDKNACKEADDASHLQEGTCLIGSAYGYTWNESSKKCEECSGWLLAIALSLMAMIL